MPRLPPLPGLPLGLPSQGSHLLKQHQLLVWLLRVRLLRVVLRVGLVLLRRHVQWQLRWLLGGACCW